MLNFSQADIREMPGLAQRIGNCPRRLSPYRRLLNRA